MARDFNVKFSLTIRKLKEGKWMKWPREVRMLLRAQHAWSYINGMQITSKDGTTKKTESLAAHNQIVSALSIIIEISLQHALLIIKDAKEAWMKLKEKMYLKGIIVKLEAFTSTIQNHFDSSTPTSTTIFNIKDSLTTVFEVKEPPQEEWQIQLATQRPSGVHHELEVPMTSSDIVKWIKAKHREKTHPRGRVHHGH
jgi:hypothetical protein